MQQHAMLVRGLLALSYHSHLLALCLYCHRQASATKLGYDEALWNGNGKIAIENKDWEELSEEHKKAAELLGFDEDEWDDSDDEDKPSTLR